MFDVNIAVQEFRATLAKGGVSSVEDLDELEDHLHAETEQLVLTGLSQEEAFLVAAHRLGRRGQLEVEDRKAPNSSDGSQQVFWMVCGAIAYISLSWGLSIFFQAFALAGLALRAPLLLAFGGGILLSLFCVSGLALYVNNHIRKGHSMSRKSAVVALLFGWIVLRGLSIAMGLFMGRNLPLTEYPGVIPAFSYSMWGLTLFTPLGLSLLLYFSWQGKHSHMKTV